MREIISLQLGQRSNYLATHFWNIQESYFTYSEHEESLIDHDVHFRAGYGADGSETFTPRTLIYDLKGGFGSLRKYNALYDIQQDDVGLPKGLWDGSTAVQKNASIPPNEYQQNLEAGLPTPQLTANAVRYWSDFNRVYYHPRSIVQLSEYELSSRMMPFEEWGTGEELFRDLDREHDLIDRDVRPFAEECDQLSGLQIFTGADDAWGGFAARYIDRLRDEFGKRSIWVWAVEDGNKVQRQKQMQRLGNSARSMFEISEQSSAYVPLLSPPERVPDYIHLDDGSEWSNAALLATAMETMTLPARLRGGPEQHRSLADLESVLNVNGNQKIYQMRCTIGQKNDGQPSEGGPSNMVKERQKGWDEGDGPAEDTQTKASSSTNHFDVDFSTDGVAEIRPGKTTHTFGQVEVCRGVRSGRLGTVASDSEVVGRQQRRLGSEPIVEKYHTALAFPLLGSFPRTLFAGRLAHVGSASTVNVVAALSTNSRIADRIRGMRPTIRRIVSVDDREDLLNGLEGIGEAYLEGWDGGSDSGSDEE